METNLFYGRPIKEAGYCEREGIEHSWEMTEVLTSNPPIPTRTCKNCGKKEHLTPSTWN
jgi:hypothetical protein